MTGPEHYRAAERYLQRAEESDPVWAAVNAAQAQVHATLAQAAAMVDATNEPVSDLSDWHSAQGITTPDGAPALSSGH